MSREKYFIVLTHCSKDSFDFEVHASGFKAHVSEDHNVFHYLMFLVYLSDKRPEDYTSLEDIVAKCVLARPGKLVPTDFLDSLRFSLCPSLPLCLALSYMPTVW